MNIKETILGIAMIVLVLGVVGVTVWQIGNVIMEMFSQIGYDPSGF